MSIESPINHRQLEIALALRGQLKHLPTPLTLRLAAAITEFLEDLPYISPTGDNAILSLDGSRFEQLTPDKYQESVGELEQETQRNTFQELRGAQASEFNIACVITPLKSSRISIRALFSLKD